MAIRKISQTQLPYVTNKTPYQSGIALSNLNREDLQTGVYIFAYGCQNVPETICPGSYLIHLRYNQDSQVQIAIIWSTMNIYTRRHEKLQDGTGYVWKNWIRMSKLSDIPTIEQIKEELAKEE